MYSCGWKCSIAEYGARGLLRSLSACRRRRTVSSLAWPTRLSSGATFSGGGGGSSMLHLHVALRTPFAFIVVDKYSVPPKVSMTRTPHRSGFKVICCRFGPSFQTKPYPSQCICVPCNVRMRQRGRKPAVRLVQVLRHNSICAAHEYAVLSIALYTPCGVDGVHSAISRNPTTRRSRKWQVWLASNTLRCQTIRRSPQRPFSSRILARTASSELRSIRSTRFVKRGHLGGHVGVDGTMH
jgi:hypothetical protein